MPVLEASELRYDPYDVDINADPYPVFRRLREEAPLYYDAEHDFSAVSRYADVERVAGAGNETTTRLIGWMGKTLADHPDQRRELVEDRSLIPNAVEETLRYEPVAPHVGRYVAEDVELHGETVPEGSAMLMLVGAANRDDRKYADPDRFDIHRANIGHLTFGYGPHFCLGAALARLEGRIALDEVLNRFPEWEIDVDAARLSPTSTVRGWETLPATIPTSV